MTTTRLGGRSDTNPLPTAHTACSGRGSRQGNHPPYHFPHSGIPPLSTPLDELMKMTQYRTEMPYSSGLSAQHLGYSGHPVTEGKLRSRQAQHYYWYQTQQGVRYAPARADSPVYGTRALAAGYGPGAGQDTVLNSCQQSAANVYQSVPAGSVRRDYLQIPVEQPSSYPQPESFPPYRQMPIEQLEHLDGRLRQAARTSLYEMQQPQQQGPRSLPHSAQSLSHNSQHFQPQTFHVHPPSPQLYKYVQGNPSLVYSQCYEYSNVQSHGETRASEPSFQYNHAFPYQATQAASRQCSRYLQAHAYTGPSAVPTPGYSYYREPALVRPAQHQNGHSSITANHHHHHHQAGQGLAGNAVADLPNTAHVPYQQAQGVQQDGIHAASAEDRSYHSVQHDASSSGYQTAALGVSRVVSRPEITDSICANLLRSKDISLPKNNLSHKPQEQLDTVPASQAAVQPLAPSRALSGSQPHSRVSSDCTQKQPAQQGDASDRKDRSFWDSIQASLGVAYAGSESECSTSNVDAFSTIESQQSSSPVFPVSVSRADGMEVSPASDSVSRFPPPLVHCSMIHSPNISSVSHCNHASSSSSSSSSASGAKQTHSNSSCVDNITESPITLSSLLCEARSQSSGKSPACAVKKEANMEVDPTLFEQLRLKIKTFLANVSTDLSPTKSRQSSGSTCTQNSRSGEPQDSQSSRESVPPAGPDTEDRDLESGVLVIQHNDSFLDELLESDVDIMKKMYLGSSGTGTSQELETDSRSTGAEGSVSEDCIETSLANVDPCDSNFNYELSSGETRTNIFSTMAKADVDSATTQTNKTLETVSTKISNDEDKMLNLDSLGNITHTCLTCKKHFAHSDLLEEHLLEHTESQVDDRQTPADTAGSRDTVSRETHLQPNLDSNKKDDKSMVVKMNFSKQVPTKENIWTCVDKRARSLSCSTDSVDNEKLVDNHCEKVSSQDTFLPKALKTNPGSLIQPVCSILKHSSTPSASVNLDSPAHCASSVKPRQAHVRKPLIPKTSPNRTKSQDSSAVSKQVHETAAGLKSNQQDSAESVSKTCHQDALKNSLSSLSSKDTNRSSSSNSEKQHGSHSRLARSPNANSQTSTTEKLLQDMSKPTTPKPSGHHTNRQDSSTTKTHLQEKQTSSSQMTSRSAKSENKSDAAKPIDKDSHARKSPKSGDDSCWKVLSNGQIFRVRSRRKSIEPCDYSQCFLEEMRNADYEASSSPKETSPVSKHTPQVGLATQSGDRSETVNDSGSVPKVGENGLAPTDKTEQEAKTKPLTPSDAKVKSDTCSIDRKCGVGAKTCRVKKSVSVDSDPSAKNTCDRDAVVGTKAGHKTVHVVKTKTNTASHSKSESPGSNGKAEVETKPGGVKKSVSIDSAPSAKETCEGTETSCGSKRSHSEIVDHKDHDASQAEPRKHTYSVPKVLPKKNHKQGSDIGMTSRDKPVLEVIDKTRPQTASDATVKSETCRNGRKSEVGAKPGGVKKSVSLDSAPSVKKTCEELEGSRVLKRSHSEIVDHKDPDSFKAKARKHTDTANGKSVPKEQSKKNHKNGEMSPKKHCKDSERPSASFANSAEKRDLISEGSSHRQLSSSRTERSGSSGKSGDSKKYCVGDTDKKRHLSADDCFNSSKTNAKKLKTDVSNDRSSSQHGVRASSDGSSSAKRHHESALQAEISRKVSDLARVVLEKRSSRTLTLSVESQPDDKAVPKRSDKIEDQAVSKRSDKTEDRAVSKRSDKTDDKAVPKRSDKTEDQAVPKRSDKTDDKAVPKRSDKATAEQLHSKKRANNDDHASSSNSSNMKKSNSGEGSKAAEDSASLEQKTSSSKDTVGSKGSTSLREESTANKMTISSSTDSDKPASNSDKPASNSDKPASNSDKPASNSDKPASNSDKPASKPPVRKYRSAKAVALERSAAKNNLEKTHPHVKEDSNVSNISTEKHVTEMDTHNGTDISSQKIRPVVDKSSSSDKVVERRRPGVKPILGPIVIDNDVCFEFCTNCQTIFTSIVKYGQHTCVTLTWDSTEDDSNNGDAGKEDEPVLNGTGRKNRDGEDKTKGESNNTASESESNDGDGNVETCRPDNHRRKSTEGGLTSLHTSSKTGRDKSRKTKYKSARSKDTSGKTRDNSEQPNDSSETRHNSGKTRDNSEQPNDSSETRHNSGKTRDNSEKPNNSSETRHNSGKTRDNSEKPNVSSETRHNSGKTRNNSEQPNNNSETRHNSGKRKDESRKGKDESRKWKDESRKRKDESRKSKDKSGKTAEKSEQKKDISRKTKDKSCGRASKSQCNEDKDFKSQRLSPATSPEGKKRIKDNSRETSSKTDQQMFSCEKCNEKYSSRGGLLHHLRNYHMKK